MHVFLIYFCVNKMNQFIFLKDLKNLEFKTHAYCVIPNVQLVMDEDIKYFQGCFKHLTAIESKELLEKCVHCSTVIQKSDFGTLALEFFGFILANGENRQYHQRMLGRILCSSCYPVDISCCFLQCYVSCSGSICDSLIKPLELLNDGMRIFYSLEKYFI